MADGTYEKVIAMINQGGPPIEVKKPDQPDIQDLDAIYMRKS